jgi:hypothetical protein
MVGEEFVKKSQIYKLLKRFAMYLNVAPGV